MRRVAGITAMLLMLALTTGAIVAAAQQGRRGSDRADRCYSPEECPRTPYNGTFTFARVFFDAGAGSMMNFGGGFGGEPPWHHDRPDAERNLSSILREISFLRTFTGWYGGNVFALDDPEIFRYPVLWMAEPGYWRPTPKQVESLRAYLLKGGFIIFDDFRAGHWYNFEEQMRRVFPELQPIRLRGDEPVFRSFFEVDPYSLQVRPYPEIPEYWGIFEDNDTSKRQLAIINYNNDIGEYMEFSATGWAPVDVTNEAYKLAVNYVMYALMY